MIALLKGFLADKHPSRIILETGGVGYDVQVPLSTFYTLGEPGAALTLRIHTHVREDVIALYGFATSLEQDLFERLIAISGVGPKLALAVLSGIEPADLIRAVRHGDVARLTAIPGVGKKTAERIGLELKDRLPASVQAQAGRSRRRPATSSAKICSRPSSTSATSVRRQRRRLRRPSTSRTIPRSTRRCVTSCGG